MHTLSHIHTLSLCLTPSQPLFHSYTPPFPSSSLSLSLSQTRQQTNYCKRCARQQESTTHTLSLAHALSNSVFFSHSSRERELSLSLPPPPLLSLSLRCNCRRVTRSGARGSRSLLQLLQDSLLFLQQRNQIR